MSWMRPPRPHGEGCRRAMNRRALLMGMAARPRCTLANAQGKSPVVGFLVAGNAEPTVLFEQFKAEMRNLGYVDGQNLRIEFRAGATRRRLRSRVSPTIWSASM